MFPITLLLVMLPAISLTLSVAQPFAALVSAANRTISTNSTSQLLDEWPQAPFRVHITGDFFLNIVVLSFWDPPVDKENIKISIIEIAHEIRTSHGQRTPLDSEAMFSAADEGMTVRLEFYQRDMKSITYRTARLVANTLFDLTQQYGPRQIIWSDVESKSIVASHVSLIFEATSES